MSFPTVLFVAGAMAIGALLKQIFQHTRLPYTVVLMVMGLAVGLLAAHVPRVAHYTALGKPPWSWHRKSIKALLPHLTS